MKVNKEDGEGEQNDRLISRAQATTYLWKPDGAAAAVTVLDADGGRCSSLSTADVRSAMPGLRHQEGRRKLSDPSAQVRGTFREYKVEY